MKKFVSVLSIVFALILVLYGCSNSTDNNFSLVKSEKNYKLYAFSNSDGIESDYNYFIFNNNGDKIDSGYYESAAPQFHNFDNGVLKISVNAGTFANETTYYNLETSLVSDNYENVYYDDGEITVYINYVDDSAYIFAKEIFNSNYLLKEKLDTGGVMITDFNVSINDKKITVEHTKGKNYNNIIETFNLS